MKKIVTFLAAIVIALAANAQSLDIFNHLGIGASVGTTGISVNLATPVTSWLTLRAGADFMPGINIKTDVEANYTDPTTGYQQYADIDLDCGIGRTQGNVIINFYPIPKAAFYVSAGLYFGGNKFVKIKGHSAELEGMTDGTIEVGDYNLPVDKNGNVHGGLKVKSVRPYLGLGWGRAIPRRLLAFNIDLGVQFQGKPEVYSETGDLHEIAGEVDNDFTKIIDNFKVYPVLSFRLSGKIF